MMALLAHNIDTHLEAVPAEYARLVPGPTSTTPARRRFAMPDTTPAGEAAYRLASAEFGDLYYVAGDVVRHSTDYAAVRRAAACQAFIAERLGFGRRVVLTHLRQAARARRMARGGT